jgi:hypothetical protein
MDKYLNPKAKEAIEMILPLKEPGRQKEKYLSHIDPPCLFSTYSSYKYLLLSSLWKYKFSPFSKGTMLKLDVNLNESMFKELEI